MKYVDKEKTTVHLVVNGRNMAVPRGHRLWTELGIDEAEATGGIEDADPQIDYSGS